MKQTGCIENDASLAARRTWVRVLGISIAVCVLATGGFCAERIALPLSLKDAVDIAVARNFGMELQRLSVPVMATSVDEQEAVFEPRWDSSVEFTNSDTPSTNLFSGGGGGGAVPAVPGDTAINALFTDPTITLDEFRAIMFPPLAQGGGGVRIAHDRQKATSASTGIVGMNKLGAQYSLDLWHNRFDTNGGIEGLNPRTTTSLGFSLAHPLLRNSGRPIVTTQLRIAELQTDSQLLAYRLAAIELAASVEQAYWVIHKRINDIDIAAASIKTATDLLQQNIAKVEVGVLRPIEVLSAESGLSMREQRLIVAKQYLADGYDVLLRLLELRDGDDLWDVELELTDKPILEESEVDEGQTMKIAKAQRIELQRQDLATAILEISKVYSENQLLPSLDLMGGLATSGLGGNAGNSYDSLVSADHLRWSVGLMLSIPIGNRAAHARDRRASLQLEQDALSRLEIVRTIEKQVRESVRAVQSTQSLVKAAGVTVEFAAERLAAEETAYQEGITTSHEVLRFEEDLANARAAYNQALIDHRNALVYLHVARGDVLESVGLEIENPLETVEAESR